MANYDKYNSYIKEAKDNRTGQQKEQAAQIEARVMRYRDQKERFERTKEVAARVISMN